MAAMTQVTMVFKFMRLTWHDRLVLLQSGCLIPLIALGIRWLGFKRVVRWLERHSGARNPFPPGAAREASAYRTWQMVWWTAHRGLYSGNCLSQSLALWWLLRRHGIPAEVRFGVLKDAHKLAAHAWVELAGSPLNDGPRVAERYKPFLDSLLPSAVDWS